MSNSERSSPLRRALYVAELPDGTYIDIDTPHACEAFRRAGVRMVRVEIVGRFTEEDCRRIGIVVP